MVASRKLALTSILNIRTCISIMIKFATSRAVSCAPLKIVKNDSRVEKPQGYKTNQRHRSCEILCSLRPS